MEPPISLCYNCSVDFDSIKLGIVTLTIGNWHLMPNHVQSILETYPYPVEFYIIPNFGLRISLSAAMNKGFRRALNEGCNYIGYSSDDSIIGKDCLQNLLTHLDTHNLWYCGGAAENTAGWDTFVVNPEVFEKVGFWDEDFYPAYFEDNDWYRRIILMDSTKWDLYPVNMQHLGSQTIANWDDATKERHHRYFNMNGQRYERKWGGTPHHETYTEPWGGMEYDGSLNAREVLGDFLTSQHGNWQGISL